MSVPWPHDLPQPLYRRILHEVIAKGVEGAQEGGSEETRYAGMRIRDFIEQVLGEAVWSKQGEICDALDDHRFVAVRSCHSAGKSHIAARVAVAFLHTRPNSIVITTAPTNRQVKNVLWRYINAVAARHGDKLLGRCLQMEYQIAPDWYALGFKGSNENSDAFQGFHCFDEEHTILTRRGWLGIDEITESDEVLSVPPNGEAAEWMPVTAVHRFDHDGELNVLDSKSVSFAVTDNHRFVAKQATRPSGVPYTLRAYSDLPEQTRIRTRSGWRGTPFSVPEPFARYGMTPEHFAEFLGFWLGDGGLRSRPDGRSYEVIVYQTKGDDGYLREHVLAPFPVTRGRDYWAFSDRACAEWLRDHIGARQMDRRIPRWMLDAPHAELEALRRGFFAAEGDGQAYGQVYNSNAILMDQMQEVTIKLGNPGTIGVNTRAGAKREIGGIATEARHDCLTMRWQRPKATDGYTFSKRDVRREHHVGRVWCISTPYQTFYTRRNGRVFLSGNSENLLLIVDEAAGVPEPVFDAADAILTGAGASCLLIGNPTSTSGTFRDAFHRDRDLWHGIKISAYDTPNFTGEGSYPALIDEDWVERQKRRHGEDSAFMVSRVEAEFPADAGDTLIPLVDLEGCAAQAGELEAEPGTRFEAGLDVARFGDDESSLTLRRGPEYHGQWSWGKLDTMETTGRAIHHLTQAGLTQDDVLIKVDATGIGSGVADRLRELGWDAVDVHFGSRSSDSEKWPILRHELWWQLRERVRARRIAPVEGVTLDEVAMAQASDVKIKYNSTHTMPLVETKDEAKRRGVVSPDRAESWILAFGQLPPEDDGPLAIISSGGVRGRW